MSGLPEGLQKRLQEDVQHELERREWAEPEDYVMAEYVCVLLANGNPRDHVHKEMAELVGSDFDPEFLDWLFSHRDALVAEVTAKSVPRSAPVVEETRAPETAGPSTTAGSRMFTSAVEGTKRKADADAEPPAKRRLPDGPLGGAPTGPRSMRDRELMPDRRGDRRDDYDRDRFDRRDGRDGGRSLADRLGPRGMGRGGMNMRGGGPNGRGGHMNGGPGPMGPGFRPQFGGPGMPPQGGMMMPNQQEMMMQMMAMQANMAQMAQQMAEMNEGKASPRSTPTRGGRPPAPAKLPPGTKLGGHAVSSLPPKASVGPIPDKPSSTALCKFGVGCSNARCTYSHPSPAADEKSGMVLSEAPCEAGKECKDAECIKSHVSPAAVLGAGAGLSRVLCKYQNCTNPSCQFRHEDAEGNFIPPPALAGKAPATAESVGDGSRPGASSDDVHITVKASMDEALDDTPQGRPCRYAERCTRADCKFTHPASRPNPRGGKAPTRGRPRQAGEGAHAPADAIAGTGMTPSRKFAAPATESKLNPGASAFTPAAGAAAEKDLDVSM